jgi:hypothetical protein
MDDLRLGLALRAVRLRRRLRQRDLAAQAGSRPRSFAPGTRRSEKETSAADQPARLSTDPICSPGTRLPDLWSSSNSRPQSWSIYGERGIIDVNELIGALDRKGRLAAQVAASRGWSARSVSKWLIVADSSTSRLRVADHRAAHHVSPSGRAIAGPILRSP